MNAGWQVSWDARRNALMIAREVSRATASEAALYETYKDLPWLVAVPVEAGCEIPNWCQPIPRELVKEIVKEWFNGLKNPIAQREMIAELGLELPARRPSISIIINGEEQL